MNRPIAGFGPWATEANFTSGTKVGQPTKVAPNPTDLAQGLIAGAPFPSQKVNYALANAWEWITYLDTREIGGTGNQTVVLNGNAPSPSSGPLELDVSGKQVSLLAVAARKGALGSSSSAYDLKLEYSTNGGSSWNELANDIGAGAQSVEHTLSTAFQFPIDIGSNGRVRLATKTNAGAAEVHPATLVVTYAGPAPEQPITKPAPTDTVWFVPGGDGANAGQVSTESELQAALDSEAAFGLRKTLVVDGRYGSVTFTKTFDLYNIFDVVFVNCAVVTLNIATTTALFADARSVRCATRTSFVRTGTPGVYLVKQTPSSNTGVVAETLAFENISWEMSATNPSPIVSVNCPGNIRLRFENCSLSAEPTDAEQNWHTAAWIFGDTPASLTIEWTGSTAGILSNTSARLFWSDMTGFTTRIYYRPGKVGAAALTWSGRDWAATTPTIYNMHV